MAKEIKVPKEVMEVFYESEACGALAADYDRGLFPSLKAIYYATRAVKADKLAWRAMFGAHPEVMVGTWHLNIDTGLCIKEDEPVMPGEFKAVKKTRAPRKPKGVLTEGAPV